MKQTNIILDLCQQIFSSFGKIYAVEDRILRGLDLQIPPPDPESWHMRLDPKALAEAAAKYARRKAGDDWL